MCVTPNGRPKGVDALKNTAGSMQKSDMDSQTDREHCMQCHKKLTRDDIGLHKKLVNRGAETFCCKCCLAEKFKMTIEDCDTLIAHFKEDGCSLFF